MPACMQIAGMQCTTTPHCSASYHFSALLWQYNACRPRQGWSSRQEDIHLPGSLPPLCDPPNHQALPSPAIASSKHSRHACRILFFPCPHLRDINQILSLPEKNERRLVENGLNLEVTGQWEGLRPFHAPAQPPAALAPPSVAQGNPLLAAPAEGCCATESHHWLVTWQW